MKPIYTPPQGEGTILRLLSNLADYLNGDVETLIKSAIIHYQYGNGRTGRIINVLYLILKGHLDIPILYLSSYIIENKTEYCRLLLDDTAQVRGVPWI